MRSQSAIFFAAYLVCLVFVISFILFEVLDIDGSDFTPPLHRMDTVRVTEDHDIRRAVLPAEAPLPVVLVTAHVLPQPLMSVDRMVDINAVLRSTSRAHRFLPVFPRASLDALPLA